MVFTLPCLSDCTKEVTRSLCSLFSWSCDFYLVYSGGSNDGRCVEFTCLDLFVSFIFCVFEVYHSASIYNTRGDDDRAFRRRYVAIVYFLLYFFFHWACILIACVREDTRDMIPLDKLPRAAAGRAASISERMIIRI